MTDKLIKIIEFVSLPWKLIIAIGIVISLFISLSTVDNRFAKSDELDSLAITITKDRNNAFKLAEAQTVKTFQTFHIQQIILNKGLQLQILNIQKENLDKQYYNLKREMRKYPEDIFLKQDFEEIKQQKIEINKRINKILN